MLKVQLFQEEKVYINLRLDTLSSTQHKYPILHPRLFLHCFIQNLCQYTNIIISQTYNKQKDVRFTSPLPARCVILPPKSIWSHNNKAIRSKIELFTLKLVLGAILSPFQINADGTFFPACIPLGNEKVSTCLHAANEKCMQG